MLDFNKMPKSTKVDFLIKFVGQNTEERIQGMLGLGGHLKDQIKAVLDFSQEQAKSYDPVFSDIYKLVEAFAKQDVVQSIISNQKLQHMTVSKQHDITKTEKQPNVFAHSLEISANQSTVEHLLKIEQQKLKKSTDVNKYLLNLKELQAEKFSDGRQKQIIQHLERKRALTKGDEQNLFDAYILLVKKHKIVELNHINIIPKEDINEVLTQCNLPKNNAMFKQCFRRALQDLKGLPQTGKVHTQKVMFGLAQVEEEQPKAVKLNDGGKEPKKTRISKFAGKAPALWVGHYNVMNFLEKHLGLQVGESCKQYEISTQQLQAFLYIIEQEIQFWHTDQTKLREEHKVREGTPEENIKRLHELKLMLEKKLPSSSKKYAEQNEILNDYLIGRGIVGVSISNIKRKTGSYENSPEETILKFEFRDQEQRDQVANILGINYFLQQNDNGFHIKTLDAFPLLKAIMRTNSYNLQDNFNQIEMFYNVAKDRTQQAKENTSTNISRRKIVEQIESDIESAYQDYLLLRKYPDQLSIERKEFLINRTLNNFYSNIRALERTVPIKSVKVETAPAEALKKKANEMLEEKAKRLKVK